jgi:hypothetical protein
VSFDAVPAIAIFVPAAARRVEEADNVLVRRRRVDPEHELVERHSRNRVQIGPGITNR